MSRFSNIFVFMILPTIALALVGERAIAQPPDSKLSPAAVEWVKNNPPGSAIPTQPLTGNKKSPRPRIPPDEREAIGLPPPTWTAQQKVDPSVHQSLEEQKRLIQSNPAMAEFQPGRPCGLQGMSHVAVYLKHDRRGAPNSSENQEAIRAAQSKVLAGLTAAEFALFHRFQNTAGLVGFVSEAGLDKLIANPDVVAVGIEVHSVVEDPPMITHQSPPKRKPGEIIKPTPIERKGKVEVAVNEALMKSADGYVFVIVNLTRIDLRSMDAGEEDTFKDKYLAKLAAERQLGDKVLTSLTADEFMLRTRTYGFWGFVNAAGLAKLARHEDVESIGLDGPPVKVPERPSNGGKRWTP